MSRYTGFFLAAEMHIGERRDARTLACVVVACSLCRRGSHRVRRIGHDDCHRAFARRGTLSTELRFLGSFVRPRRRHRLYRHQCLAGVRLVGVVGSQLGRAHVGCARAGRWQHDVQSRGQSRSDGAQQRAARWRRPHRGDAAGRDVPLRREPGGPDHQFNGRLVTDRRSHASGMRLVGCIGRFVGEACTCVGPWERQPQPHGCREPWCHAHRRIDRRRHEHPAVAGGSGIAGARAASAARAESDARAHASSRTNSRTNSHTVAASRAASPASTKQ